MSVTSLIEAMKISLFKRDGTGLTCSWLTVQISGTTYNLVSSAPGVLSTESGIAPEQYYCGPTPLRLCLPKEKLRARITKQW